MANYKDTLNLPRTSFPMKADLPKREPPLLKKWEESDIYAKIINKRKTSSKKFILHDGPPYANGHIHMGHVLNKILKDICVKYFTMNGNYSPYIPGWDCHGLPVEHQLFKELGITKNDIGQVEFRKKAFKYALKYVKIQAEEFKRLGVFGDWQNAYLTLTKDYEADILEALAELYEKGFIYKDFKPVNWCKTCETALAEAEVEYEDRTSPSIYVKFKAGPSTLLGAGPSTYFIIWTTTPWTLIANVAIAVHPNFKYSFVETGNEIWIMANSLVKTLMGLFGINNYRIVKELTGSDIPKHFKSAAHPFIDRESLIVLAEYVTSEEGTGCVHTAPGHGQEDYLTGKKYNLPIIMPVEATGKFSKEAGEFAGINVFEANRGIIEKMRKGGALIKDKELVHSYPHCWRCKEPIIFRATEQWFMKVDHLDLRKRIVKKIENDVEWIPKEGMERISAMVNLRPDWCLSRQRYWGVPIPAFRCVSCHEVFTTAEIIRKTSSLTRQCGADVWFEKSQEEFLPKDASCKKCGGKVFEKENDILDVWFDSGVSHKAVLERWKGLAYPADLYLEGSDQHRGWFQAAIITSMGMKNSAPYRKVLTHGFVVDGEGKKMSKSIGNVINPEDVMKEYGADILRLWVASSDYAGDIKLSGEILERLADGYRKIRNTFKFLLSNLYDFNYPKDAVREDSLLEIDRWMLSRLSGLILEVTQSYDEWEFHRVYRALYDFCVYEISAFYLDVLKDILYVEASDSKVRRSAQTVLFYLLTNLSRIIAPILSFTAEEVWASIEFGQKDVSIHMADWPDMNVVKRWKNEELNKKWAKLLALRDGVMKILETKREKGIIGSSLEAALLVYSNDKDLREFTRETISLFPMIFKVSQAGLTEREEDNMEAVPGMPIKLRVEHAEGQKCQRCWNFEKGVGENKKFPDLCMRCYNIVAR